MRLLAALTGAAAAFLAMLVAYELTCYDRKGQRWIATALKGDDPTPPH